MLFLAAQQPHLHGVEAPSLRLTPQYAHRCFNEVRPNGRGTRLTPWVCRDRMPQITACGAHPTSAHWLNSGLFRAFRIVARVYPGDTTMPVPEVPSVALNVDHVRGLSRSAA